MPLANAREGTSELSASWRIAIPLAVPMLKVLRYHISLAKKNNNSVFLRPASWRTQDYCSNSIPSHRSSLLRYIVIISFGEINFAILFSNNFPTHPRYSFGSEDMFEDKCFSSTMSPLYEKRRLGHSFYLLEKMSEPPFVIVQICVSWLSPLKIAYIDL